MPAPTDSLFLKNLRKSGKILTETLAEISRLAVPGATGRELDRIAEARIRAAGARPAYKNYRPDFGARPFPATVTWSVDAEAVHGIPGDRPLRAGELLKLDCGVDFEGAFTDICTTVLVGGDGTPEAKKLFQTARRTTEAAIAAVRAGAPIRAVAEACEKSRGEFEIFAGLCGHGVGRAPHEPPTIFHTLPGSPGRFRDGQIVAIEPVLSAGSGEYFTGPDGWVCLDSAGGLVAQFEKTVRVLPDGVEVIASFDPADLPG